MSLAKLSLAGNNFILPGLESLVSDIPAGDGKIANIFLQCTAEQKPLLTWIKRGKKLFFCPPVAPHNKRLNQFPGSGSGHAPD
jgi:hypothetical protein